MRYKDQDSYALKPRPYFCRTLPPVYKKNNFLPKEFITHKLEGNLMLLMVQSPAKNEACFKSVRALKMNNRTNQILIFYSVRQKAL